jgi:hypothetical protein
MDGWMTSGDARASSSMETATQIGLTIVRSQPSMSPIRGDVKKKSSPFPLRREVDVVACIQPNLSSGEAVGALRIPDRQSQLMVSTRRFHDAMVVRRLRFRKLRKQEGWL